MSQGAGRQGSDQTWAFGGAVALVALAGAVLASQPLSWLLAVVPDDAFYYLKIAQNLVQTGRSTFDGLHPTNGYHPAWLAVLTGLAVFIEDPVALLRSAVALSFGFLIASGFVTRLALRRLLPGPGADLGAALWLVNPVAWAVAVQSVEGSIYFFALSVAVWVYCEVAMRSGEASRRSLVGFGVLLGCAVLARSEAVFAAAALAAGVALRRPLRAGPGRACAIGVGGIAAVGPWLLLSQALVGSWAQNSGTMKRLWAAADPVDSAGRLADAASYLWAQWVSYPILGAWGWGEVSPGLLAANLLITLALAVVLVRAVRRPRHREAAVLGLLLLGGAVFTGAVYGLFLSDRQYWYKAQPAYLLFLVGYGVLAAFLAEPGRLALGPRRAVAAGALAVLVLGGASGLWMTRMTLYPWQRQVYQSQLRFDALVPEGSRVGCFNAGIPGYFGSHSVINLDGLVNASVIPHYRARTFGAYIVEAEIDYIADEAFSLGRALDFGGEGLRLEAVASAPLAVWGRRFLWRVDRS